MIPLAITNPSIELAVACRSFQKLDLTFPLMKIFPYDDRLTRRMPLSLDNVLNHYKLRPLLRCENLQSVFLDGIYGRPFLGGRTGDLATLLELGKRLVKKLLVEQKRRILVEVGMR